MGRPASKPPLRKNTECLFLLRLAIASSKIYRDGKQQIRNGNSCRWVSSTRGLVFLLSGLRVLAASLLANWNWSLAYQQVFGKFFKRLHSDGKIQGEHGIGLAIVKEY